MTDAALSEFAQARLSYLVRTEAAATELAEKPPAAIAATRSAIDRFLRTSEMLGSDGAALEGVLGRRSEAIDAYVDKKLK